MKTESIERTDSSAHEPPTPLVQSQSQFEELISTLASRFLAVSKSDPDRLITQSLRLIGECLNVDLCRNTRFDNDGKSYRVTHFWRVPRLEKRSTERLEGGVTQHYYPWHISQLIQGKTVAINRLDDYPPEADVDKKSSLRRGDKSSLVVPLLNGKTTMGCLSIKRLTEEVDWSERLVSRLQLIAAMISSTLNRIEVEDSLRKQEVEQAKLRNVIYRATRISAMGEMTAAISHEINQPLTAILSNAQAAQRFLAMPNPSLTEFQEIAKDIVSDVKRAKDVILRLRSLFQQTNIESLPIDINATITELFPLFRSQLVISHAHMKTELAAKLPLVRGDRVQIHQILLNLIINAIEAMRESDERELKIKSSLESGYVRVGISDSGPGIPPEDNPNLFQPFFTTKKGGMGMGLAISKAIIDAHGGTIGVENNPKGGSTFFITLPVLENNMDGSSV